MLFLTELLFAELTLERLESLMNCLDVSLEDSSSSKLLPTFFALMGLEFLMNCLDVPVKIPFFCECLATSWTSAVVDVCVDCALVQQQGSLGIEAFIALMTSMLDLLVD